MSAELSAYLVLILVGFLPSDLWRLLGVVLARGVDEQSELLLWVRAVAVAVLAGVIAKLALFPPGALADIPMPMRLTAIACGFAAFVLARGSVFVGVTVGELALVTGGFWFAAH